MRIAYVSPMPPEKTGIADYSAAVAQALKTTCEVDLYTSEAAAAPGCYHYRQLVEHFDQYDIILYHMGNHHGFHGEIYDLAIEIPGFVMLHELSIHDFFIGKYLIAQNDPQGYIDEMANQYGEEAGKIGTKAIAEQGAGFWGTPLAAEYPMIQKLLEGSKGIIVHSEFIKGKIESIRRDIPVFKVPFPAYEIRAIDRNERRSIKKAMGYAQKIVIGIFGYVTPTKRHQGILQAISQLEDTIKNKIHVIIAGHTVENYRVSDMIQGFGLADQVTMMASADSDAFNGAMKACDFCINLRYPSNGETSASLYQILGKGIPTMITDIGAFSEVDVAGVVKIPIEEEVVHLVEKIEDWVNHPLELERMSNEIIHYMKANHSLIRTAEGYQKAFSSYLSGEIYGQEIHLNADAVRRMVRGMNELGIMDDTLADFMSTKIFEVFG